MSCTCPHEVFRTSTCPTCGAEIQRLELSWDGWVGFGIDRDTAAAALTAPPWSRPSGLEATLQKAWLVTTRVDVRLDSSWRARLRIKGEWTERAGWIDRWFDEIVLPTPRHDVLASTGVRGFGEPEDLPILRVPQSTEVPWQPLLTEAVRIATGAERVLQAVADIPPAERREHQVLSPVWVAHAEGRYFLINGETGGRWGAFEPDTSGARLWTIIYVLAGLLLLMGSAALVLPGIVIWPLLLLTGVGSFLGHVLLVAAGVPFSRTRSRALERDRWPHP